MNLSLHEKNALVCGSTQGIGFAIAKELALLGANCILMARNKESLQTALAQLHQEGTQKHEILCADFSDTNAVKTIVNELASNKTIHILINNTGGPPAGKITDAKDSDFLSALNLHLINNHNLATAVLEGMKQSNYGRIVNIVSTSVKIPLPNLGVSNTTRAAVAAWAKTLANEVAVNGITVNNVLPGATSTVRLSSIIENKSNKTGAEIKTVEAEMLHEIPMRRFGLAEEIAAMAAFLTTPAAAYITGQSICVDGGRTGSI
ncbi:MAG: SDR family oxidoreductase [Bacteroidetes bacterium]|nr:SDR family oxidoreductase [Bacteroidota bacterium]